MSRRPTRKGLETSPRVTQLYPAKGARRRPAEAVGRLCPVTHLEK